MEINKLMGSVLIAINFIVVVFAMILGLNEFGLFYIIIYGSALFVNIFSFYCLNYGYSINEPKQGDIL